MSKIKLSKAVLDESDFIRNNRRMPQQRFAANTFHYCSYWQSWSYVLNVNFETNEVTQIPLSEPNWTLISEWKIVTHTTSFAGSSFNVRDYNTRSIPTQLLLQLQENGFGDRVAELLAHIDETGLFSGGHLGLKVENHLHGSSVDDSFSYVINKYTEFETKCPRKASEVLKGCSVGIEWLEKHRNGQWPTLR